MALQLWHQVYQRSPVGALFRILQTNKRHTHHRGHLSSPLIAEEIFKQFDFSDYKGCQIIDINPGIGVYSAFLNAAIQPSKHLLLEPKPIYSTALDILKHTHPSYEYHQVDGTGYQWFEDMTRQGLISARKTRHDGDVNKSLLINCHLQQDFSGRRVLHQLITSIATRSWFHSFGRVRMLVWCSESDRQVFIPRVLKRRKRAALYTELLVECQELVGGIEPSINQTNIKQLLNTEKRLESQRAGIELPKAWSLDADGTLRNWAYAPTSKSPLKHMPLPEDVLTYYKMPKDPRTIFASEKDFVGLLRGGKEVPALISFTPRVPPPFLANNENFVNTWELFDAIMKRLFMKSNTELSESINLLGPGAGILFDSDEELMKTNIKAKRCSDLTLDEFVLIVQAYERWPHKDISALYDDWVDQDAKYERNKNYS